MNLETALSYVILSFILFGWLVGIFETTSIRRKAAESGGLARLLATLIAIMVILVELIAIQNIGFNPYTWQ